MRPIHQASIHHLWDRLHQFDARQTSEALAWALAELSALLDAQVAGWCGVVRMHRHEPGNPMDGWRSAGFYSTSQQNLMEQVKMDQYRLMESLDPESTAGSAMSQAGTFRIGTLQAAVVSDDRYGPSYQSLLAKHGIVDGLYVTTPLSDDIESWMSFHRMDPTLPGFSSNDIKLVETAVRPMAWFHQRVATLYGLKVAESPLTPAERRVLEALLSTETEQAIADQLGLTQSTVHTYCARLCRKLNVRGRSGLLGLWLNGQTH